ncbi:MAG: alanine--tRNA ligase, partial [Oscillospiraceae bacterium]|nr:alanine--tRNA ligase [Oscillospiraceae bacterium]
KEANASGATALFGEKYGESVRVVSMGDYSKELCGGTHLDNTAKVGAFRIVSESSVASGVRRIEALTGKRAVEYFEENLKVLSGVSASLKTKPAELSNAVGRLNDEIRELKKELESLKDKASSGQAGEIIAKAQVKNNLKYVAEKVPGMDAGALRKLGDALRDKDESVVALLVSAVGEKVSLLCVCGKDAVKAGVKAGDIIKAIAPVVGGKGGGKPDSAMGGGKDLLKLDDALASVDDFVAGKLGL